MAEKKLIKTKMLVWKQRAKPGQREALKDLLVKLKEMLEKELKIKSARLFMEFVGGTMGTLISLIEFDDMATIEKWIVKYHEDAEWRKIVGEMLSLIEPGTRSFEIWDSQRLTHHYRGK